MLEIHAWQLLQLVRNGGMERGRIEDVSKGRWAVLTKSHLDVPKVTLSHPVWSACLAAWGERGFSDMSEARLRCVPEDFPGNMLQPSPQGPCEDWRRYPDHVSDVTVCRLDVLI